MVDFKRMTEDYRAKKAAEEAATANVVGQVKGRSVTEIQVIARCGMEFGVIKKTEDPTVILICRNAGEAWPHGYTPNEGTVIEILPGFSRYCIMLSQETPEKDRATVESRAEDQPVSPPIKVGTVVSWWVIPPSGEVFRHMVTGTVTAINDGMATITFNGCWVTIPLVDVKYGLG